VFYHDEFKAFTDVPVKPNLHLCSLPDRPKDKSLISFEASVIIYQMMHRKTSEDKIYVKNLQNC
jgi:hypothetical protein